MTDQDTTTGETPEAESARLLTGESAPQSAAVEPEQNEQGEEQPTRDPGEDEAATEGVSDGEPRRKQTAQERIDEMTRFRREAERDRDFWREQALKAQPQQQPPPAQAPQPSQGDEEPDPAAYTYGETDAAYIRDLARFEARQEFHEAAQRAAQAEHATRVQAEFEANAAKVAEQHEDFFEVVGPDYSRAANLCSPDMAAAMLESEAGPALAYHLAKNPAEARRIAALPTHTAQIRELTKLETRLTAPPPAPPPPPPRSNAPPPPPTARGTGGRFRVAPDTDDFKAFQQQYGPGAVS
jgi:hypothetical protein